nr:hypothetical protein [Tanacetum cinerariifolium]
MCEIFCQFVQKKQEEKQIEEEQAAKAQYWKPPVCYDDDDDEESSNSLNDNISELPPYSAITPNEPVLSTEEPDISLKKRIEEEQAAKARWKIPACCGDDDDDYNFAITPILSTEEPKNSLSMGDEHLDTISATESDEVIKSSVEDLVSIPSEFEDNPTPYSEFLTKSSSTSPKSFLEETNTLHNSLPEFEKFCFDLEEIN